MGFRRPSGGSSLNKIALPFKGFLADLGYIIPGKKITMVYHKKITTVYHGFLGMVIPHGIPWHGCTMVYHMVLPYPKNHGRTWYLYGIP